MEYMPILVGLVFFLAVFGVFGYAVRWSTKECTTCGLRIPKNAKLCTKCGRDVTQ